ncbi:hypothetical protein L1285_08810 [Pseudoalteromonas sp. DL2-H2.2]|uniref:PPC domain-containing protein n=1 Tax=Pseudoalteromonas sp. DL2-H2.2 TaxID=2908889 RepID=UPI001F283DE0|nr:PPC domain-containing protein [Pseudoalteromonas sp. DL2-H2.2]MCF2908422.1 hypothetical protein [Pseudoalteromonas sp. DL2-H2.2]
MKLTKVAASVFSLCVLSSANANTHDLTPAGDVARFAAPKTLTQSVQKAPLRQFKAAPLAQAQAETTEAITPACPTLNTGNLYTLSGFKAGDTDCYHFEITERSKTTALLVGQTGASNINLSVLRHNEDNTYSAVGTSANPGTDDEVIVALTEPGHYYWFFEAVESDGSAFNFGAAVATQLDSYEFNDTVTTATQLSTGQNVITANMDSVNDIDLYQFTAVNGQNLVLNFADNKSDEFIFEIYNSGWVPLSANELIPISGLQPNQVLTLRVRANDALPVNPSNQYTLSVQSIVASFSDHSVSGERNVNRIPLSSYRYLTTQAYRKLSWSLTLNDSAGAPIKNAEATLRMRKDINDISSERSYTVVTDENGKITNNIELGACNPNVRDIVHTEYSFGYKNTWRSDVEVGLWQIRIPTNLDSDGNGEIDFIGIGGKNHAWVTLGHICDQTLISSEKS